MPFGRRGFRTVDIYFIALLADSSSHLNGVLAIHGWGPIRASEFTSIHVAQPTYSAALLPFKSFDQQKRF